MLSLKNKGRKGEDIACKYLTSIGYEIMERNFSTEIGEIDVIAAGDGYLIFVEVKTRISDEHGYGADAVDYHKRKKINQVASQYIKKYRLYNYAVRFDVVEVYTDDNRINHIENAFDSYLRY